LGLKNKNTLTKMNSNSPDSYTDPPNAEELVARFKTLDDKKEIRSFIDETFPGWLIASTDRYTIDYPHLLSNWRIICERNNIQPQKIVIVDQIFFDKKDAVTHNLIMTVCEEMTRKGYVIRRKEELTGCEQCFQAMPSQHLWAFMKQKGVPVPPEWSSICSSCSSKEEKSTVKD
jgi:hypothetical protein